MTKIENMLLTISYSESAYWINLWQSLKTHFYLYYVFNFFLVVNKKKNSHYVVNILIFMMGLPDYSMTTVQIMFPLKLKVFLLLFVKTRNIENIL